jgi:hypothetical protein
VSSRVPNRSASDITLLAVMARDGAIGTPAARRAFALQALLLLNAAWYRPVAR